jgi:hypothetical protein
MTVLTPLALLGLLALAVPLLLHLLRKQEKRTVVFPALRYLKRSTREHARIVRLRQLVLLALRLCAIVLIAFAGARLILPVGGNDNPPAGVAIVIDNGLTSGAVVGGARVLDSLLVRAQEALGRMGPRDQVWIVPVGSPLKPSVPLSPDRAAVEMAALMPTDVPSSILAALDRAASLLDAAAPELREVIVISDLRPEALESTGPAERLRPIRVVIAPPPVIALSSRGVSEILISGGLAPRAGEPGNIRVRLSGGDVAESTVRGYVTENLLGTTSADAEGNAVLPLPRLPAGWVEGRVEIEPDDLRGDDVRHFTLQAIPPPTVRVLGSVVPFLEEALSVLDEAGRIRRSEEVSPQVIVTSGVPGLEAYPEATVIVVPSEEAALLPSLNQALEQLIQGWNLRPEPARNGTELRVNGGLLAGLLPSRIDVRQAYTIGSSDEEPTGSALLTLSDGRPWIMEWVESGRRIIVLASPFGLEASNLASSASMLPLIDLLLTRASGPVMETEVVTGQPFRLPDGAATVSTPRGVRRPVMGVRSFSETENSGVYRVLDDQERVLALVAVNPVPPASTSGLTASEAASLLRREWQGAVAGEQWPGTLLQERRGREVARPMLFALLLLLVAEGWLASAGFRSTRPDGKREL